MRSAKSGERLVTFHNLQPRFFLLRLDVPSTCCDATTAATLSDCPSTTAATAATAAVRFAPATLVFALAALLSGATLLLLAPAGPVTAAQLQMGHVAVSCRCAGQCSRPK